MSFCFQPLEQQGSELPSHYYQLENWTNKATGFKFNNNAKLCKIVTSERKKWGERFPVDMEAIYRIEHRETDPEQNPTSWTEPSHLTEVKEQISKLRKAESAKICWSDHQKGKIYEAKLLQKLAYSALTLWLNSHQGYIRWIFTKTGKN